MMTNLYALKPVDVVEDETERQRDSEKEGERYASLR